MKTNWQSPEILDLDLQNTFGGTKVVDSPDGPIEWDPEQNLWKEPYGVDS